MAGNGEKSLEKADGIDYRVIPELEKQLQAGKIDLTAIVNTHQYVELFSQRK